MAAIVVKAFNGMRPISDSVLLDNGDAQVATNVLLNSGTMKPLKSVSKLTVTLHKDAPQTIFRYDPDNNQGENSYWLEWAGDVDVMRSPIAQDEWKRLYWTDPAGGGPRYAPFSMVTGTAADGSMPGSSYLLGVPKPLVKPTVTDFSAPEAVTTTTRSYRLTYLSSSGKESAPGKVFTAQAVDGKSVKLTNLPTDNKGDTTITDKRLYRLVPDPTPATTKTYRRIAEIDLVESEYEDTTTDAAAAVLPPLPAGIADAPSPPGYPPIASASEVVATAGKVREYSYTVDNYNSGGITYQKSPPSAIASITADDSQTVTISGLALIGGSGQTFSIYRRDAGQQTPLQVLQIPTTQTTVTDVIALSKQGFPRGSSDGPIANTPVTPTVSVNASTSTDAVNRLYMVTFVDGAGHESIKSPDSEVVVVRDGVTAVSLYHSEPYPSGVTKKRLYRQDITLSSGVIVADDANWKFVAENSVSATNATDTTPTASLPGSGYSTALQGLPPSPTTAPTTKADIPASVLPETRIYCYTLVTAYGEEGPPSPSSDEISCDPAKSVTLTIPNAPGGPYNFALKRIYRSNTGTNKTKFQFVGEIGVAIGTFVDDKKDAELVEVLESESWIPPPVGLKGLRLMANGAAVGFVGNSLYLSEPNLPHAWPHEYPINDTIVAIGVFGQTVAVLTNSYPYLFQGIDPAAMASSRIELPQACVAKRSLIETGDGVIYASPDGLTMLGQGATLMTQPIMSRAQWQAYKPESMQCFNYNGRVLVTYDNGTARGLLILDVSGTSALFTTCDLAQLIHFVGGHYSPQTDGLYLSGKTLLGASGIYRFESAAALLAVWRSKVFRQSMHENFGFGQVICKSYSPYPAIDIYADGVLKYTKVITGPDQFRLPAGFKALDWMFELSSQVEITEVFLATSTAELQSA